MALADVAEVFKMALAGLPIIGTLVLLHRLRNDRFDRIDATHKKLEAKVDKLDVDFDGLNKQLGSIVADVEKRFLTREEHTEAVNRLDGNIVELTRTIGQLNGHLFDLARARGGAE